jgi:ankyrin repeat protein
VNSFDGQRKTPLHVAAELGRDDCMAQLLAAGAKVDARTVLNDTPMHLAAVRGHHRCLQLLADAGADLNARGHIERPVATRNLLFYMTRCAGLPYYFHNAFHRMYCLYYLGSGQISQN